MKNIEKGPKKTKFIACKGPIVYYVPRGGGGFGGGVQF